MSAHIGSHGLLQVTDAELARCVRLGVRAAHLAVHRASYMRYTQGPDRFDWHHKANRPRSYRGEVPHQTDCSGFTSWLLWDCTLGLAQRAGRAEWPDFVNGEGWAAGHTGTQVRKGRRVTLGTLRPLDLVFYGDEGWRPEHVAVYVGGGQVVSFGSDPGPFLLPVRYRSDVGLWAPRRYIA